MLLYTLMTWPKLKKCSIQDTIVMKKRKGDENVKNANKISLNYICILNDFKA